MLVKILLTYVGKINEIKESKLWGNENSLRKSRKKKNPETFALDS